MTAALFDGVDLAPRDPILGINEAFAADPRPGKVNLGVGVYTDESGNPAVWTPTAPAALSAELKRRYDFVVIDNTPAGLVSDAVVNLQRADYPIYVFRSDYSRKFFINNLIRLKEENKIYNISCILNGVDLQKNKSYGYGYGYGSYNYGYGYGYGFGYYEEESAQSMRGRAGMRLYDIIKGKKHDEP